MRNYRISKVWRQREKTPTRQNGEWHWHAPVEYLSALSELTHSMEIYREHKSIQWLACDTGFALLSKFDTQLHDRNIPGYVGYFIPAVDTSGRSTLAADLPEVLLNLPPIELREARPDEVCPEIDIEVRESGRSEDGELPWNLIVPVQSDLEGLSYHMLFGGGLRTRNTLDMRTAAIALASMIEWIPVSARLAQRTGSLGTPVEDTDLRRLEGVRGPICRYLALAWELQKDSPTLSVWKGEGWAMLRAVDGLDLKGLERLFTRLFDVRKAWKDPGKLQELLRARNIVAGYERKHLSKSSPAPLAEPDGNPTADHVWFRLLNYWGRGFLPSDDSSALKLRIAELLKDLLLLDQFLWLQNNSGSGAPAIRHTFEARLRQVCVQALLPMNKRRELTSCLRHYFELAEGLTTRQDSKDDTVIKRFIREVSVMDGNSNDPRDRLDDARIEQFAEAIELLDQAISENAQRLKDGEAHHRAVQEQADQIKTDFVNDIKTMADEVIRREIDSAASGVLESIREAQNGIKGASEALSSIRKDISALKETQDTLTKDLAKAASTLKDASATLSTKPKTACSELDSTSPILEKLTKKIDELNKTLQSMDIHTAHNAANMKSVDNRGRGKNDDHDKQADAEACQAATQDSGEADILTGEPTLTINKKHFRLRDRWLDVRHPIRLALAGLVMLTIIGAALGLGLWLWGVPSSSRPDHGTDVRKNPSSATQEHVVPADPSDAASCSYVSTDHSLDYFCETRCDVFDNKEVVRVCLQEIQHPTHATFPLTPFPEEDRINMAKYFKTASNEETEKIAACVMTIGTENSQYAISNDCFIEAYDTWVAGGASPASTSPATVTPVAEESR